LQSSVVAQKALAGYKKADFVSDFRDVPVNTTDFITFLMMHTERVYRLSLYTRWAKKPDLFER